MVKPKAVLARLLEPQSGLSVLLRSRLASLAPVLTLLALMIFFSVASPTFLQSANLLNILAQVAVLSIVAAGTTLVLLIGEIDLSIANVSMSVGLILALLYVSPLPFFGGNIYLCVFAGLVLACVIGLVSGLSVAVLGIPSFAVTLATMQISQGITMTVTEGAPIYEIAPELRWLGSSRLGPIPGLSVIAAAALILFHLLLRYTHFGRQIYAVGGNRMAAKMVGIRTDLITTLVLVISALTAGIGGVLTVARLGSAQTFGSEDLLIDSLAAVVIGGTALSGGVGGIPGTVLGVLILGVLNNGLAKMSTNIFLKYLFKGLILLAALIINVLTSWVKERASTAQIGEISHEKSPPQ